MDFQTTFDFTLPKGYVSEDGSKHNKGSMRIATAGDEIQAIRHPKVRNNPDYMMFVVLSKVIVYLEGIEQITPEILENFYLADMQFLQNMYATINGTDNPVIHVTCPHCGKEFEDTINFTGQK